MNTTYKYPLVEVTWDDAESDDGWDEPPAKLEPAIVLPCVTDVFA